MELVGRQTQEFGKHKGIEEWCEENNIDEDALRTFG
jgi:hypothetical protein